MPALIWLVLGGCLFIGDDDLAERMDLDRDGVARPDDCDDGDDTIGAASTWLVDSDGDGFGGTQRVRACTVEEGLVATGGDCDDADATVHPDQAESCNGKDDDCDGETDEPDSADATTWFRDDDGDGWGGDVETRTACAAPSGFAAVAGDCDDADPAVHPDTPDRCDGVDTDCNGEVDDLHTWPDVDGDGYGDPAMPFIWPDCFPPDGFVINDEDCDDTRADVNPGAPEVCDDIDRDEDCDGLRDDEDEEPEGQTWWYVDVDDDGFGQEASPVKACDLPNSTFTDTPGDCDDTDPEIRPDAEELWYDGVDQDCDGWSDNDADQDGWDVGGGGDCDDADRLVNPDATEACGDEIDNDCDGDLLGPCALNGEHALSEADYTLTVSNTSHAGEVFDAGSDLDGDGFVDLLLGAGGLDASSAPGSTQGGAYIVYGPVTADDDITRSAIEVHGVTTGSRTGYKVGFLDDLNGDGFPEVGIVARDTASGLNDGGELFILAGPLTSTTTVQSAMASFTGTSRTAGFGWAFTEVGDQNADGDVDLLLTAYNSGSGEAHLFLGPLSGAYTQSESDVVITGTSLNRGFGHRVARVGDLNGDGVEDVAISDFRAECNGSSAGAVYLLLGPLTTSAEAEALADTRWCGAAAGDMAGLELAAVGDTNQDGADELLIGGPHQSGGHTGQAWLVQDAGHGPVSLSTAAARLDGEVAGDWAGHQVAGVGDVNGDSYDDIMVSSGAHVTAGAYAGAHYLIQGPITGVQSLADANGELYSNTAGLLWDAGGVGDIDGDGYPDVGAVGKIISSTTLYLFVGGPG